MASDLINFAIRARWTVEQVCSIPGCPYTYVLDLETKSVPCACANSLGGYKEVRLMGYDEKKGDIFKVMTGCRNQPRKGEVFCNPCLKGFSDDFAFDGSKTFFLKALYPLGNLSTRNIARRGSTAPHKDPGPEYILVKEYGQTYNAGSLYLLSQRRQLIAYANGNPLGVTTVNKSRR